MIAIGQFRPLTSALWVLLLAFIINGCGGGGDDSSNRADGDPVAGPVPVVTVNVGQTATLDGSKSHAGTGKPDSYNWTINSKPDGSTAQLQNTSSNSTSLVADKKGTYVVQLEVTANGKTSPRALTIVDAKDADEHFPYNHYGLTSDCVTCHDGTQVLIDGSLNNTKIGDHMATSNTCVACHSTFAFSRVTRVDHLEVFGRCSECHNGVTAIGKSIFHAATNAECDDCHNTRAFVETAADGSFDHSGIDRACTACHNGIVAIGKNEGHVATESDCGYCHTTESFLNAYVDHTRFKATGVVCAECHNGTNAMGPSQGHPDMTPDCGVCHGVRTFSLDGGFNHSLVDSISQPCGVCHDGTFATGKGARLTLRGVDHEPTNADCGNCHNTVAFMPAFGFDHSQFPEVAGDRCDRCHGNGNTGMHANHIPIGDLTVALNIPPDLIGNYPVLDCAACHTPGTFTSVTNGGFDHTYLNTSVYSVVPVCSTCHDNVRSIGKTPNHIVTDLECDSCHLNTDTFTGATVDHTNFFDNCASCHNGDTATGKPVGTHVPVDAAVDCSVCHVGGVVTPTFIPASNFTHQTETTTQGCQVCHNGSFSASTGNLVGKPRATHIPTQDDCDTCHTTASFTSANFDHSNITRGCEGCHNGRFTTASNTIRGKPNNHVPTNQDCHFCHNFNEGWIASVQTTFRHTGITRDCYTCHNGNFEGDGARGVADDPNTPDPHPQITVSRTGVHTPDCVACHSAPSVGNPTVTFATHFVDHSAITGNCTQSGCHGTQLTYALSNAHTSPTDGNDCELCHIGGGTWTEAVFDHANIPSSTRCDSCHDGSRATGKDAKLARTGVRHVTTSEDCRVCHNTTAFAGATFNHQNITSGCIDCHNGDTATGKHVDHVPTNQDCYVCHQTTGFVPGTFDHAANQITGNCASCHNGRFATGKSTGHVSTTADCGVCHNTNTFIGATFDHSTIGNQRCDSCHGGDKPQNHVQTTQDCGVCHTTATFLGATWVHDASTRGRCLDCHVTGGGATPQPTQGHFVTGPGVQCDACHTTTTWADQGTFDHCDNSSAAKTGDTYNACGDYPGDHRAGKTACVDCHRTNRAAEITYPNQSQYAPDCAGCHAGDFRNNGDHNSGGVGNNRSCGNARGCHRVNASGF